MTNLAVKFAWSKTVNDVDRLHVLEVSSTASFPLCGMGDFATLLKCKANEDFPLEITVTPLLHLEHLKEEKVFIVCNDGFELKHKVAAIVLSRSKFIKLLSRSFEAHTEISSSIEKGLAVVKHNDTRGNLEVNVRETHGIPDCAIMSEECVRFLDKYYCVVKEDEHPIMHPRAAIILTRSTGRSFPTIAQRWFSKVMKPDAIRKEHMNEYDEVLLSEMDKKHYRLFSDMCINVQPAHDESENQFLPEVRRKMLRIRPMAYASRTWDTASLEMVLKECEKYSS